MMLIHQLQYKQFTQVPSIYCIQLSEESKVSTESGDLNIDGEEKINFNSLSHEKNIQSKIAKQRR